MRNNIAQRFGIGLTLLAAFLLVAAPLTGCRTASPEAATYATIDSSRVAVVNALRAWGDYCRSVEGTDKRIPLAAHMKVKAAYDLYRAASIAAVDAALAYQTGTGPAPDAATSQNLASAAGAVLVAIAEAQSQAKTP